MFLGGLGFMGWGLGFRDSGSKVKGFAVSRFRVWGFGMVLGMSYLLNKVSYFFSLLGRFAVALCSCLRFVQYLKIKLEVLCKTAPASLM